jgi:histidinol-phosphate aminotransferase
MKYRKILEQLHAYKPGKSMDEIKEQYNLSKIVRLNANENPYGTDRNVIKAINDIKETQLYPDNYCTEVRNKLAKKYNLLPENFIFGDASNEIISMISRTFIDKDDEVITCIPGFELYMSSTLIQEGKIIGVPLKDNKFDLNSILSSITNKTKLIYLTNPHNPTGTIITKEEQSNFLSKVPKDILVVLDEAYYEFAICDEYPESTQYLSKYNNICILRTFSKAYGLAGLRIGYGIGSKELINELEKVRNPYNVSAISQVAASAALNSTFMQEGILRNREVVKYVYELLDKAKISYIKTYSNFIMIDTKMNSKIAYEKLLAFGYVVRAGYKEMNTYIRVTIGTKTDMESFINALKIVMDGGEN